MQMTNDYMVWRNISIHNLQVVMARSTDLEHRGYERWRVTSSISKQLKTVKTSCSPSTPPSKERSNQSSNDTTLSLGQTLFLCLLCLLEMEIS